MTGLELAPLLSNWFLAAIKPPPMPDADEQARLEQVGLTLSSSRSQCPLSRMSSLATTRSCSWRVTLPQSVKRSLVFSPLRKPSG